MIFPIYAYGSPVLKKVAADIDKDYEGLNELIENMWDTMYKSDGVGLAAPQIGKSIRLFIIDASPMDEEDEILANLKKVFINAQIVEEEGEEWEFNEGCLSVPNIREDIKRKSKIKIQYYDENFNYHEEEYDDIAARVIQHEHDHLNGVLFVDRLSALKKRLLKGKLIDIAKGKVQVSYKMKCPIKK